MIAGAPPGCAVDGKDDGASGPGGASARLRRTSPWRPSIAPFRRRAPSPAASGRPREVMNPPAPRAASFRGARSARPASLSPLEREGGGQPRRRHGLVATDREPRARAVGHDEDVHEQRLERRSRLSRTRGRPPVTAVGGGAAFRSRCEARGRSAACPGGAPRSWPPAASAAREAPRPSSFSR